MSEKTLVDNVSVHGTGALNIDGTRIAAPPGDEVSTHSRSPEASKKENRPVYGVYGPTVTAQTEGQKLGRWPANLVLVHTSGCELEGWEPGGHYVINRWTDGAKPFGNGAGHPYESSIIETGMTPVWKCADNCHVLRFDQEAGPTSDGGKASRYFVQLPALT